MDKFTVAWQKTARSFPTLPHFLLKKKKSLSDTGFSKHSAKRGVQPHRPRTRHHDRKHECIVLHLWGGITYAPATVNQMTLDYQLTTGLHNVFKSHSNTGTKYCTAAEQARIHTAFTLSSREQQEQFPANGTAEACSTNPCLGPAP